MAIFTDGFPGLSACRWYLSGDIDHNGLLGLSIRIAVMFGEASSCQYCIIDVQPSRVASSMLSLAM